MFNIIHTFSNSDNEKHVMYKVVIDVIRLRDRNYTNDHLISIILPQLNKIKNKASWNDIEYYTAINLFGFLGYSHVIQTPIIASNVYDLFSLINNCNQPDEDRQIMYKVVLDIIKHTKDQHLTPSDIFPIISSLKTLASWNEQQYQKAIEVFRMAGFQ